MAVRDEKLERAKKIAHRKMDFLRHVIIYLLVMAVLAIIFGSVGLRRARTSGRRKAFAITGLVPASYRIGITMPGVRTTPTAASGAWTLSSIMLDGADVADRAFDLRPGAPVAGVVATFTDRPTDLSGTLVDQTGRPAPGYPIVVFSADRDDWRQGSRRIAIARPSTDGSFRLVGLPAGRYHLAAVVSLERSDVDDPSFLEQLVPASLTVLLNDGVRTVQHLKLAR